MASRNNVSPPVRRIRVHFGSSYHLRADSPPNPSYAGGVCPVAAICPNRFKSLRAQPLDLSRQNGYTLNAVKRSKRPWVAQTDRASLSSPKKGGCNDATDQTGRCSGLWPDGRRYRRSVRQVRLHGDCPGGQPGADGGRDRPHPRLDGPGGDQGQVGRQRPGRRGCSHHRDDRSPRAGRVRPHHRSGGRKPGPEAQDLRRTGRRRAARTRSSPATRRHSP